MVMTYTGQKLVWDGFGPIGGYLAASGLEPVPSGGEDYRKPQYQHLRDKGPIPEGDYLVPLKIGGTALADAAKGELLTAADYEIQEVPSEVPGAPRAGSWNLVPLWGCHRAKLKKVGFKDTSIVREGFYIHDSDKLYTHGCIEVASAFFDKLIEFAKNPANQGVKFIALKVDYTGVTSTKATKR